MKKEQMRLISPWLKSGALRRNFGKLKDAGRLKELADAEAAGRVFAPKFKIGDKILRCDHVFAVQRIEMVSGLYEKHGFLYRCGNEGTEDYCAFYDSEIGDTVFPVAENE